MIKKFLAKLINFTEQTEDFAKGAFRADQGNRNRMTRAYNEQVSADRNKKYVSEQVVPSEERILGPSDSGLREEEK